MQAVRAALMSSSSDAVAVEQGLGKYGDRVARFRDADAVFLEPEVAQYLLCGLLQARTGLGVGVELVQGKLAVALEYQVFVFDNGSEPLGGGDDFLHADLSVVVCVYEIERVRVELQPGRGAAQHGPELLVQLTQVGDVLSPLDVDSRYPSPGTESPGVVFLVFRHDS